MYPRRRRRDQRVRRYAASASNAIIIGFNVRPDATAKATAETEGVDIRLYKVIYQAIEDVEAAMKGMLDPVYEEKIIGHAEVRQIFKHPQSEISPVPMSWTAYLPEAVRCVLPEKVS